MRLLLTLLLLSACVDRTDVRVDGKCSVEILTDAERVVVRTDVKLVPLLMPMPVKVVTAERAP